VESIRQWWKLAGCHRKPAAKTNSDLRGFRRKQQQSVADLGSCTCKNWQTNHVDHPNHVDHCPFVSNLVCPVGYRLALRQTREIMNVDSVRLSYGRYVRQRSKFKVHDEKNECRIGDTIRFMETRPLSKDKRWRFVGFVERAK